MNRFPNDRSVLIMDNCAIHKSDYLRELVEAQGLSSQWIFFDPLTTTSIGSILLFLPPYSPDFNPIEESFSAGQSE